MAGARDVASFGVKYLADEAAFRRTVTYPVLLWEHAPTKKEEPLLFATNAGSKLTRPSPGRAMFFALAKTVQNAFADEVTLGRTRNNDVSVEDNSVSRFHAYFAPDKKGTRWSLVDANSTAGTFLAGKRLKAKLPVMLEDQMKMKIGQVDLQFLLPDSFLGYLQKLAAAGQKRR